MAFEKAFDDLETKIIEKRHTNKICRIPSVGFQSFFNVFTQISPFEGEIFGWKTLVKKNPLGGDWGKSAERINFIRNFPPANGVSSK